MFQRIMLHRTILHSSRRLYHEDSRLPVVRKSSERVRQTLRQRRNSEASPRVEDYNPVRAFEPFPFLVTEDNKAASARAKVTPLCDIPYEEQLSIKEHNCKDALRRFARELYKTGTPVRLNVSKLPCHINRIVGSPTQIEYRNMDGLNIWRGIDGETPTVGYYIFPIGVHGDTVAVEPNHNSAMKEVAKALVDILQEFIRNKTKLSVCYDLAQKGGWRQFDVRSNWQDELMLIGKLSPRGLKVKEILEERDLFTEFITKRSQEVGINLASLYYILSTTSGYRQGSQQELLYGTPTIIEKFGQFKIHVSPDTYTYQNPPGACVLFDTIRSMLKECFSFTETGKKPLIIDGKCASGLLAFNLADMAQKVVGIDENGLAVENAKKNAEFNGITNVEFINSNAYFVLERIVDSHTKPPNKPDVIVCCDARNGVGGSLIKAILDCRDVNKLLYLTSKIDSDAVMQNLLDLCQKSGHRSQARFVPIMVTPVDVHPQTNVVHTVIVLERVPTH